MGRRRIDRRPLAVDLDKLAQEMIAAFSAEEERIARMPVLYPDGDRGEAVWEPEPCVEPEI